MNGTSNNSIGVSDLSKGPGSATVVQIESSKLLPWLILSCLLSGFAVASSIGAYALHRNTAFIVDTRYKELERENRLTQLQVDNMKVAMLNAGVDPAPHLKGEAP